MAGNPLVAELKRLQELEAYGQTPEGQSEAQQELEKLLPNLYQVAATSGEISDQPYMGQIEQMLRTNDRAGLEARLGTQKANELHALYGEAVHQHVGDKSSEQSWAQAAGDAGAGLLETAGSLAVMAGSLAPPADPYEPDPVTLPELLQYNHQLAAPLYSDAFGAHQRATGALTEEAARQHKAEADAASSLIGPDGKRQDTSDWMSNLSFGYGSTPGTQRFFKDAGSSFKNSAEDSVVLTQGISQAAVSMGEGAFVQGVLESAGKTAIEGALQTMESRLVAQQAKQLASIGASGAVDDVLNIGASRAQQFAFGAAKKFAEHLDTVAAGGSTAITEAAGAYDQTATDIMSRDPQELLKTSQTYRDLVKQASIDHPEADSDTVLKLAQSQLATITAQDVAVRTGLSSSVIGAYLPEGQISAFKLVSKGGNILSRFAQDTAKEGLEEFLQGTTGGLATNIGLKNYVDPSQDMGAGLGQQAGEGALFGLASSGALKGRELFHGGAALAGEAGKHFADKKIAKLEAEGNRSAEKLSTEAHALYEDTDKIQKLFKTAQDTFTEAGDQAGLSAAAPVLDRLVRTPVVNEIPETVQNLPKEMQGQFAKNMNRVTAITRAATMFNETKDPELKSNIGVFLNDLMEPVRKFQTLPPELDALSANPEAKKSIETYQKLLSSAEALPQVQKAQQELMKLLKEHKFSESSPKLDDLRNQIVDLYVYDQMSLKDLEKFHKYEYDVANGLTESSFSVDLGEQNNKLVDQYAKLLREHANNDAKRLAVLATSDLSLHGSEVPSETVAKILAHASGGKSTLTETQRQALAGSLALIRAREEADKLRTEGNSKILDKVTKDHIAVGRQVSHETDTSHDKISAKQYLSLITKAVTSGDTELAKKYLARLGNFATSHNNKISALNQSFEQGGTDVPYQQFIPKGTGGQFAESSSNPKSKYPHAFVNPNSKSTASIDHARTVDAEGKLLTTAHNEAVKAFPELEGTPVTGVDLHPSLRSGTTQEAQQAVQKQQQVQEQSKVAPVSEETPKAENAPVAKETTPAAVQQEEKKPAASAPVVEKTTTTEQQKPEPVAPQVVEKPVDNQTQPAPAPVQNQQEQIKPETKTAETVPSLAPAVEEAPKIQQTQEPSQQETASAEAAVDPSPVAIDENSQSPEQKAEPEKTPTIKEKFEKLLTVVSGPGKAAVNHLQEAFSFRKDATRFVGKTGAVKTLWTALDSREALESFTGKDMPLYKKSIADAYRDLFKNTDKSDKNLGGLLRAIQNNLNAANEYDEKKDKDGNVTKPAVSLQEALKEGRTDLMVTSRGKVLNLVEWNEKAQRFQFNPELLQMALLAGLQWQITASQREAPVKEDQVLKSLGIKSTMGLPDDVIKAIGSGAALADAKDSLARQIVKFWGMKSDKNQPTGYTAAIPEAMANEVLRAMVDTGMVTVNEVSLHDELRKIGWPEKDLIFQTIYRYHAVDWNPKDTETKEVSPIYKWPNMLEELVLTKPEAVSFFSGDEVPVAKGQLGNSKVKVTKKQKVALQNMQKTEFRVHQPMSELTLGLDDHGVVDLFGGTRIEDELKYNVEDLKAKQSKNKSLLDARTQLRKDIAEMQNHGSLETVGKKYQYEVGSNNRMMMQGSYNPQSSKVTREILMATWSKLDLSQKYGEHRKYVMLALAQALGQKIHKKSFEENIQWAENAIAEGGTFASAIEVISNYLDDVADAKAVAQDGAANEDGSYTKLPSFPVKQFKEALAPTKIASSPLVVMALMEVARMQQAGPEQLKTFETPLYLESDGITNGPFNAMGLLSVGQFTEDWVRNVKRGGAGFGKNPTTYDQLMKEPGINGQDLYKTSMEAAGGVLSRLLVAVRSQAKTKGELGTAGKQVTGVADSLFTALNGIFGDDIKWAGNEDEGTPELDRGAGKGPVTQMVYGSGSPGVASGITSKLMKGFYEKLSAAVVNPKLWNTDEYLKLGRALSEISSSQVSIEKGKDGKPIFQIDVSSQAHREALVERMVRNPREFKFSPEEAENIQKNLTALLVNPMRQGIMKTLGQTVDSSGKLLVKATSLMANTARVLYTREIEKKVNEKIQDLIKQGMEPGKAHNRAQSEFLSENELNQIWKTVSDAMPQMQVDDQNFLVAKNSLLEFWNEKNKKDEIKFQYSMALDRSMRTAPMVEAIDNPGVAAIPYFTIGMGDARMVRELFQDPAFERAFQVFDGINIPVDSISAYGNQINKAARKAWQANVFLGTLRSFDRFVKNPLVKNLLKEMEDPKAAKNILDQMNLRGKDPLITQIRDTYYELQSSAEQAQARMVAISKVGMSFDQMSGTFQPFVSEGMDLTGLSNAEIAAKLSEEYVKALETIQSTPPGGKWLEPETLKEAPKPAPVEPEVQPTAQPEPAPAVEPVQQAPVAQTLVTQQPQQKSEPPPPAAPPEVQLPKEPVQKPLPAEALKAVRKRHESGVLVASKTSLRDLTGQLKESLTRPEQAVLTQLLHGSLLSGHKIVTGTREQVTEYQRIEKLESYQRAVEQHPEQVLHGFYSPAEKTVYLINPTAETTVHELVHAGTYQLVQSYYEGKLPAGVETEAIQRLEGLMEQFLREGDRGLDPESKAYAAVQNAQSEINRYRELHSQDQTSFQKAAALNEFMAWTLSNRDLAEVLSKQAETQTTTSKLLQLIRTAWNAIKNLIFRGKRAPEDFGTGKDMLSQIRFNTAVLTQSTFTPEESISQLVTAHSTLPSNVDAAEPNHLERVLEAFGKQVARYLNQTYSKAWLDDLPANPALTRPFEIATKLATEAASHFQMTQPLELETFHMMVMALTTEAKFNPHALTEASKIYDRFLQATNQNSFLSDPNTPEGTTENKLTASREKFEFLTGQSREIDGQGRSTMLPVFIALATTNQEFREYLAKLQMPVKNGTKVVGLNTALEAVGAAALKRTENLLSGQDHPENLKIAIDQLTHHVTKQILAGQSMMDNVLEQTRSTSAGLNGKIVSLLKQGGEKAFVKSNSLAQSDSKLDRAMGQFLKVVAFTSNEKDAAAVSEHWLEQMDRMRKMPGWARDFFGSDGLLGRVPSQAEIYDMYKKVRVTVAQTRQTYREHVPFVIHSKFSELGKPDAATYHMLYQTMGRSDLASLLDGHSIKETLQLAGDKNLRGYEIANLERDLGYHRDFYLEKINQLVGYMHGGPHGSNLLRNAYAISELFGTTAREDAQWTPPTEKLIRTIDQLVTLKYLDRMSKEDQQKFNQLVKDEQAGTEFILSYLKGQRLAEMQKATDGMARFNHYKGELPYESGRGHLIVADGDAKTQAQMELLGYEHKGVYRGSSIDQVGDKAYYYSPEGGARTQFNQGLIQNVQGTAYGVHTLTGFSGGPNAGYITNPELVAKLAKQMPRERMAGLKDSAYTAETLSPVYDPSGTVVAFERTFDPKQLELLKQDQHLGKMIGYWRGRQVEEVQAQKINDTVIEHLKHQWEQDVSQPGQAERYENLFDSKNPVIQDAVRIIPKDVREKLEESFGPGHFPVRRNLVNQIVGHRSASIGDLWTGNTNISAEVQDSVKKTLIAIFGTNAYRKMVWAERNWQAITATMRTNIVVRSMSVAYANTTSGFRQLMVRGVPLASMVRGAPRKLAEIETYARTNAEIVNLEAELHAETDVTQIGAVKARIREREDRIKRLSIWPLIEAGEFSSIADVGQTAQDFGNSEGTIVEQLEALADKLPPGLRDAARLGYIARDTALFQGLQKWVQYSDFVMKAIYYDHLMTHGQEILENTAGYTETLIKAQKSGLVLGDAQKFAREAMAKGKVTEEFNNYDLPTGRGRQYLESMGLAWFLNYKIRAAKVGLAMIRENPLQLLLFGLLPHPMAGGTPFTDNLFARLFHGSVGHALGPGMIAQPIAWNSWYNLFGN